MTVADDFVDVDEDDQHGATPCYIIIFMMVVCQKFRPNTKMHVKRGCYNIINI